MTTTIEKNATEAHPVATRTFGELRAVHKAGIAKSAHEAMLLLTLLDSTELIKMTEAAKIVGVSRAAMTAMIDRLAAAGLVKRALDTTDRRAITLDLTSMGATAIFDALETASEGSTGVRAGE